MNDKEIREETTFKLAVRLNEIRESINILEIENNLIVYELRRRIKGLENDENLQLIKKKEDK